MADSSPLSLMEKELKDSIGQFLPHVKFLTRFLCALIAVRTVTLAQIAQAFANTAQPASNEKSITRFLDNVRLCPQAFARAVAALLPVPQPWILALDRTDWKLGKVSLNLLVLAVVYDQIAIPLLWMPLCAGPSDTAERIRLMQRFVHLFGRSALAYVTADREFLGQDWLLWLHQQKLSFRLRIRRTDLLEDKHGRVDEAQAWMVRRTACRKQAFVLWGVPVFIGGRRLPSGDILVIVSDVAGDLLADYRCRWKIECLFQALKGRGFNLEATHVTQPARLERLLGLLALCLVWCLRAGLLEQAGKVKIKKHGRRALSVLRQGLDLLRRVVLPLCGHFQPRLFLQLVHELRPVLPPNRTWAHAGCNTR